MSNIIEVLEEENTFLQVQIQELLKQETEGTYQFQERLTELQELVLDKDKAYNALEAKFADMESRYLEVFEELQNKR